jgi:hypothetical protein
MTRVGSQRHSKEKKIYTYILKYNIFVFTFAPCMLVHLLYSKPTHALILNTLSHPHFKTLKLLKNIFLKTSLKNPTRFGHYCMTIFRGSSFVLSALPLLRLFASSFAYSVCGHMPSVCILRGRPLYLVHYHFSACLLRHLPIRYVAVCRLCVCVSGVPVCGLSGRELSVHDQTTHRQVHRTHTHTHRRHTATYRKGKWRSKQRKSGKFTKYKGWSLRMVI